MLFLFYVFENFKLSFLNNHLIPSVVDKKLKILIINEGFFNQNTKVQSNMRIQGLHIKVEKKQKLTNYFIKKNGIK